MGTKRERVLYLSNSAHRISVITPPQFTPQPDGTMQAVPVGITALAIRFVPFALSKSAIFSARYCYDLDSQDPHYWEVRARIEGGRFTIVKGHMEPTEDGQTGEIRQPSPLWSRGEIWTETQARERILAAERKDPINRNGLIREFAARQGLSFEDASKLCVNMVAAEIRHECEQAPLVSAGKE